MIALLAYMPFHIFWSQWLSLATGGLSGWKIAKDIFAFLVLIISLGLMSRRQKPPLYVKLLLLAITYGLLHLLVYSLNRDTTWQVAGLATVYNTRLFWFLLIGMAVAYLMPKQIDQTKLMKIVLVVSTIVCVFGVAQYLLPKDLLTHFGYSVERGVKPIFFIDDKPDLPRVMSTLRDPNSLGAFLLVPLTIITLFLLQKWQNKNARTLLLGLFGLHILTLLLTFSRAAWAGAIIALSLALGLKFKSQIIKTTRRFWPFLALGLVTIIAGAFLLRDQYFIQNVIFHSDETTTAQLDSNDLHVEFIKKGVGGIQNKPLGHGPGTAGIVSIQNKNGSYLTENYYVQIAHEVGIAGLVLFMALLAIVLWTLYRKEPGILEVALLATSIAYALMALLMHLWTNEAVAAQWWLLAGFCLGASTITRSGKVQKAMQPGIIAERKQTKRGFNG